MILLAKPQFITDENGNRVSVILPVSDYERILQELEELDDVKLYDEVKSLKEPSDSFDDYIKKRPAK